jgi:adenylate cyclase
LSPGADPEYGSDLIIPDDELISNYHATLTWMAGMLHVVRRPKAQNLIFRLNRSEPRALLPVDDFNANIYDQFRIGDTEFTLLPDGDPIERVCDADELRKVDFADPAERIESLAELPSLIPLAPNEEQLIAALLQVALKGVPRSSGVAFVQAGENLDIIIRSSADRTSASNSLRPSRRLVHRALDRFENVVYVWPKLSDTIPASDTPTMATGTDWAICIPLTGPRPEGLYLTGQHPTSSAKLLLDAPQLTSDMKFARLAGDIFSHLRELRVIQQRELFLAQLVSPSVRRNLAGQRLEELTAPTEVPVTVLFCDLRGSVQTVERGRHDLMGTWGTLSEALDVMTEAIVQEDGVIGDFQGDAAMGFWGWPLSQEDQIDRAARAALTIRKKFASFARKKGHRLSEFVCGVGLAHGPAVAGRLGTTDQAKIGVFGPVVNRAARLEAATKRLRVPILIDEMVAGALSRPGMAGFGYRVRRIARVIPQGFQEPVLIAELLPPVGEPGTNLSELNRRIYEAALDRFLAGEWSAWRTLLERFPPDGPAEFVGRYIESNQGVGGVPPVGWNGGVPVEK